MKASRVLRGPIVALAAAAALGLSGCATADTAAVVNGTVISEQDAQKAALQIQQAQFRIEECHVEGGVMDHQLRTAYEGDQLIDDLCEAWLAVELGARDAVHGERPVVDVAFGIEVAVKGAPGGTAVYQFDAPDLYDAMVEFGFEAGGFSVEDDLAHGGRVYRNDRG